MNDGGRRAATLVVLILAATGAACAPRYSGESRPIAPAQVTPAAGWVVAGAPAVRQRRQVDCGAAALAMVVARWRPGLDLETITRAAPAQPEGHRLGDLRDVARGAGLSAFAVVGDRDVLAHELGRGRPVVIGLHRPYGDKRVLSHYEVVVALHRDGRVATIDPGDAAWHVRSWDGLLAEWEPAGRPALVVVGARARTP